MPTYIFTDPTKKKNKTWTEMMTIAEMEEFLAKNPHIILNIAAPRISDPYHLGLQKPDAGFRSVLKKIKSKHRGSTIDPGNLSEV